MLIVLLSSSSSSSFSQSRSYITVNRIARAVADVGVARCNCTLATERRFTVAVVEIQNISGGPGCSVIIFKHSHRYSHTHTHTPSHALTYISTLYTSHLAAAAYGNEQWRNRRQKKRVQRTTTQYTHSQVAGRWMARV